MTLDDLKDCVDVARDVADYLSALYADAVDLKKRGTEEEEIAQLWPVIERNTQRALDDLRGV